MVAASGVYNSDVNALDWARCAVLCNSVTGAKFYRGPAGAGRSEWGQPVEIKTLFQDYRIPLWERRRWPVIVQGDSIVWTRRFGAAKAFAASPESESVILVPGFGDSDGIEDPWVGTSTS